MTRYVFVIGKRVPAAATERLPPLSKTSGTSIHASQVEITPWTIPGAVRMRHSYTCPLAPSIRPGHGIQSRAAVHMSAASVDQKSVAPDVAKKGPPPETRHS